MDVSVLDDDVTAQLNALALDPSRPLLIVDVDEVLVNLAGHLAEFAAEQGYSLNLTGYKLDGALKRANGDDASGEEFSNLFKLFFETQTVHQRVYPDAAAVLERLSRRMQIVLLTNVPTYATACRRRNLSGHGIDFPMVVNSGGKGPAIAWLEARVGSAIAFIDDSPSQIASAKVHAPDVLRIHFVGDVALRAFITPLPDADHSPNDWLDIEAIAGSILE